MSESRAEVTEIETAPTIRRQIRTRRLTRGKSIWVAALLVTLATAGTLVEALNGSSAAVRPRAVSARLGGADPEPLSSLGPEAPAGVGNARSSCSPTTDAATSGGSPATLRSAATEVASGTLDGHRWSLWSAKGQSGATGLEDGGLVLDGREYGLCPGYPNPAELEMLDVGSNAIVYGVIGYPGLARLELSVGTIDSFAPGQALPSPRVQVVHGVSFFIGALPKAACSYSALELDSTSPGVSAEHNLGFAGAGEGQGYYIADNTGNSGGCVRNQIDPISFSQGIWQLPPGQFSDN